MKIETKCLIFASDDQIKNASKHSSTRFYCEKSLLFEKLELKLKNCFEKTTRDLKILFNF